MKVIVVGGGQIGSYLAKMLIEGGHEVYVVEQREKALMHLYDTVPKENVIVGDGADPALLKEAGISEVDVLASVTGADEVNLVVSTIAKYEYGVPRVIARVNNPKNEWLFGADMGVDVKVNQAAFISHLITDEMDLKRLITLLKINQGNDSIVQATLDASSHVVGKAIQDLEIKRDAIFIAIIRDNEVIIPHGDTVFQAGDRVLALTADEAIRSVDETLH